MRVFWSIAVIAAVRVAASRSCPPRNVVEVCNTFKALYANSTFLPDSPGYADENEDAWSTTSWLSPGCIFAPSNGREMSFAVKLLSKSGVKFGVRGGGHMPIPSSNSIGPEGVLISSANLNTLSLSDDNETLSVGPGPRWTDVYTMLDGTGLAVVGARLGPVGVPGLLLGGGVSFYSYEHGLASTNDNLRGYECVLANGDVVEVTADNEFSDLFWALQGGGNSFCLVTRFDLRTHQAPYMMFGNPAYGSWEVKDSFMDSVFNFATQGHADPKSSIIPVAQYHSGTPGPEYSSTLFYNGENPSPEVLQDFLGAILSPRDGSDSLFPFTLGQYSQAVRPAFEKGGQSHGMRQRFHLLPIKADRQVMQLVHDAYFQAAQAVFSSSEEVIIGLAFNPITSQLLRATNARAGCLQGLDETPSFWIEQTYSWKNRSDDKLIDGFIRDFNANMTAPLETLNATGTYYYLNEADEGQPVFQSYPAGNLERLKAIRAKYDPDRVFTDLMPGGFKVAHA